MQNKIRHTLCFDELGWQRIEYLAGLAEMSYSTYINFVVRNTLETMLDREQSKEEYQNEARILKLRQLLNYEKAGE